jgi:multimeric flavodoxin WrbA
MDYRTHPMMKILIVSCSPRRNGNSDAAAKRCLSLLGDIGDAEVVRVHDHEIRHCLGCRKCMRLMRCVIRGDDFDRLFRRWQEADVLVIVCPVFWQSPPGAMKDFIDRSHGVYGHQSKPFSGKKAAIVSVATDGGFETQERILGGWLRYYGAKVIGRAWLLARERGDLVKNPSELRKLDSFLRRLRKRIGGQKVSTTR